MMKKRLVVSGPKCNELLIVFLEVERFRHDPPGDRALVLRRL